MQNTKISKREFFCERDHLKICCWEYRKRNQAQEKGELSKKLPAVIISHGFMGNGKSCEKYAKQFASWGYAAYTFDFNGGSPKNKSAGKFDEMSVLTEKEDLIQVVNAVKNLSYIDETKVILMGFSQGGFVSALVAAELQEQIERLILIYPALCIPDDARKGKMMFFEFDPKNIPDKISWGAIRMGKCYPQDVIEMDPFKEIASYGGPVLIIHGTADKIVDCSYAKRAWEAYQMERNPQQNPPSPEVQLVQLYKADHGFKPGEDQVAFASIAEFLKERVLLMDVDVTVTNCVTKKNGKMKHLSIPFTGFAKGTYFSGVIRDGVTDEQDWKQGKAIHCRADYEIDGKDYQNNSCTIHVVNEKKLKQAWKPTIEVHGGVLEVLNNQDCTAVVEPRAQGPVVHIYGPKKAVLEIVESEKE